MSYARSVLVSGLVVLTAACDSVSVSSNTVDRNPNPDSQIITLNSNGTLPNLNYDTRNLAQRGYTRGNVSNTYGFRYAWGNVENSRDFLGVAGILPSSDPGDAITTGSVSYSADYELVRTRSGRTDDVQSGEVLLTADFASGSGTVEGRDGGFRVDGTFRGTDLDGTVTYDGVTADLEGVIGQDRVVGAFAGHDNRGVLVGGIAGRSNQ